ncbi:MAG: hypothetical protein ABIX28_18905 [Vicinamibacterales bacterium]
MKTLTEWMREGDPVARDPGLSEDESAALRRHIVHEVSVRHARPFGWREPLTLVGALALLILAAMATDHREPVAAPDVDAADLSARPAERRQLQFSTPGGTRIIWTFDPDFSLKEPVR